MPILQDNEGLDFYETVPVNGVAGLGGDYLVAEAGVRKHRELLLDFGTSTAYDGMAMQHMEDFGPVQAVPVGDRGLVISSPAEEAAALRKSVPAAHFLLEETLGTSPLTAEKADQKIPGRERIMLNVQDSTVEVTLGGKQFFVSKHDLAVAGIRAAFAALKGRPLIEFLTLPGQKPRRLVSY